MKLTKAQQLAATHVKGNILISAGAGSGKTKVLTDRVIHLIVEHKVAIDQILIVTFTNAAAAQMKARIRQALLRVGQVEVADQVDSAFIMTFDAFAFYLVKQYHYLLNLSESVSVFDQSLYDIEKKVNLKLIFDRLYERPTDEFKSLIQTYVTNQDETLREFILKIDAKADLLPDKKTYLKKYVSQFFNSQWMHRQENLLFDFYRQHIILVQKQITFFESSVEQELFLNITKSLLDQTNLTDLLLKLKAITFPKLKPKSLSEEDKTLRKQLKDELKRYQSRVDMLPLDQQFAHYQSTQPHVQMILKLIEELDDTLANKKKQYQRYPFTDMAKMATILLQQPSIKDEIQKQFLHIMVDEYQDTNDLQEAFLRQLAQDNLFMVGDVKQSIYRFRNANSTIFQDKLKQYQPYQPGVLNGVIEMNDNFRSRPEVISAINDIFSQLMTPEVGGIYYDQSHMLRAGQSLFDTLKDHQAAFGIHALNYETRKRERDLEEPRIIAKHILDTMHSGTKVVDLETKTLRPITYHDFAILIDRKTNFEAYLEVFSQHGVPLEVYAERNLSDSDFFRVIRNLIAIIAQADEGFLQSSLKQAYISVLRSFIFQMEDDDIYRLVTGKKAFEDTPLYPLLTIFRKDKYENSLAELMTKLIKAINLEEKLLVLPDLPSNLARLQGFMLRIQQLSDLGYTIEKFYEFLLQSEAMEIDLTIAAPKQSDNAVQLMTIHKSKGLEFPYVYYPGLSKGFNMVEVKGVYQFSAQYGIQLPYPTAQYAKPILTDLILAEERQANLSEHLRLLYVALTRAKEKIILVEEVSQTKAVIDLKQVTNFADFLSFYRQKIHSLPWPSTLVDPLASIPLPLVLTQTDDHVQLKFAKINLDSVVLKPRRPSKPLSNDTDEKMLEYGSYLHECLFLLNFETLDTNFIPLEKDRDLIDRLLKHSFFQNLHHQLKRGEVNILKEYAFETPTLGKGIIDLVIIQGDSATIVDYKTNDINDMAYENQLKFYQTYLISRGLKVTTLVLVSLKQALVKIVPA
jgi:ATP-dependent helicase/nuclease subunit A